MIHTDLTQKATAESFKIWIKSYYERHKHSSKDEITPDMVEEFLPKSVHEAISRNFDLEAMKTLIVAILKEFSSNTMNHGPLHAMRITLLFTFSMGFKYAQFLQELEQLENMSFEPESK